MFGARRVAYSTPKHHFQRELCDKGTTNGSRALHVTKRGKTLAIY